MYIQGVPGGMVKVWVILSKKKCICTCVLLRTVSEIELLHCTVAKLLIRKMLRIVSDIDIYCSSDS